MVKTPPNRYLSLQPASHVPSRRPRSLGWIFLYAQPLTKPDVVVSGDVQDEDVAQSAKLRDPHGLFKTAEHDDELSQTAVASIWEAYDPVAPEQYVAPRVM